MPKAYKNTDFLGSRDGRIIRILSEYLEPQSRFRHFRVKDTVVFFGSARTLSPQDASAALEQARGSGDEARIAVAERDATMSRYYDDAREIARRLTEWSKSLEDTDRRFLVCSGGGPGIMEAANRGASDAAGISVGLGISLPMETSSNPYSTRELDFEFHYFFMRKFWFAYLAKAMIVFPGGFGTLDELFEILTLVQTRKTVKPLPIVLYGSAFWDEVFDLKSLVKWGTISPEDLDLFHVSETPDDAVRFLTDKISDLYLDGENDAPAGAPVE